MRWLLTLAPDADLESVAGRLAHVGARIDEALPEVQLDSGERVIQVEAPPELPEQIGHWPEVRAINPSSDVQLF
jgi:hypothetical protein